jgi:hypothetical protein
LYPKSADFRRIYEGNKCNKDERKFHETDANFVGLEKIFSGKQSTSSDPLASNSTRRHIVQPILALNQEIRDDFLAYLYKTNSVMVCHCTAKLYFTSWLQVLGSSIYAVRRLKLQTWVKNIKKPEDRDAYVGTSQSAPIVQGGFRPTFIVDLWTSEWHCYIAETWYNCKCTPCKLGRLLSTNPQTMALNCRMRCKTAVPDALATAVKNLNSQMSSVMEYVSEARASGILEGRHMRLIVDAFFGWECKSSLCKHDMYGEHWKMAPFSKGFLNPDGGKYGSEKDRIGTLCLRLQSNHPDHALTEPVSSRLPSTFPTTGPQLSAQYDFRSSWLIESLRGRVCSNKPSWFLTAVRVRTLNLPRERSSLRSQVL